MSGEIDSFGPHRHSRLAPAGGSANELRWDRQVLCGTFAGIYRSVFRRLGWVKRSRQFRHAAGATASFIGGRRQVGRVGEIHQLV
jgi:hypothetical protein